MQPKMVALVLAIGTLILAGGATFAATRPTWRPPLTRAGHAASAPTTVNPSAAARAVASAKPFLPNSATAIPSSKAADPSGAKLPGGQPRPHSSARPSATRAITYTVKPGDTLYGISQWFKLHGFGRLYRANMAVTGRNPAVIFPGQRITITNGA